MKIDEPIVISEKDVLNHRVYLQTKPYLITKAELELLINGQSKWKEYSIKFFFFCLGILIKILGTCIAIVVAYHNDGANNKSTTAKINDVDIYSLIFCITLSFILLIISTLSKSPSKDLIKKIRDYFKEEDE